MHDAIMVELATTGNAVTVFGWSQSAIIASLEMQRFTAMGGAAPSVIADALAAGTQEGILDFTADLQALSAQPLTLPQIQLPQPADLVAAVAAAPTPAEVVNTLARIISTNYAVLLPTVDIALALVTTLPLYTTQLFVRQLAAGNLINAIGYPLAATVGLGTIDSGRRGIAHPPRGGLGHRSKHRGPRHLTDSRRHRRPPTTVYRPRQ